MIKSKYMILVMVMALIVPFCSYSAAYMKFDGVDGESKDEMHRDWIDIESWSWGVSRNSDRASGLPTGKRQHRPLNFTKYVDKATPKLFEFCTEGNNAKEVTIELTRTDADGQQVTYLLIHLENVRVSSYNISGGSDDGGDIRPTESVTLNYERIRFTHIESGVEHSDDWRAK